MALPAAFEQRMQRLLGEEYPAFRDALARPQARGLRVSPLKIAPEQFAVYADTGSMGTGGLFLSRYTAAGTASVL